MRAAARGGAQHRLRRRARPVTVRNGHAEMRMYLAEADGLDFKLIKPL